MAAGSPARSSAPIASRRRTLVAVCGLVAALIAVTALFAGCGGGSEGGDDAADVPQAPEELAPGRLPVVFDPGQFAYSGPARDATLDQIVELGADQVRLLVAWNFAAPEMRPEGFDASDPDDPAYDFSLYDDFLKAAAERNLKPLITIGGPAPSWASNGNAPGVDPDPEAFGEFAEAIATRYSGGFEPADGDGDALPAAYTWSVWNEPNLSIFLTPQFRDGVPYSPLLYRRLFLAAQKSIRAADPGAPLLIGETAPTGSTDSVEPIPFARGVLCLTDYALADESCDGGTLGVAGWATHPYATIGQAPFEAPPTPKFVTIDSLAGLGAVLDEGAEAGQVKAELPIHVTEYGVQSLPDTLAGVPLETQAEYLAIAEQFAYADPRVKLWGQYLMRDDAPRGGTPAEQFAGFESGLRLTSGAPKPAYNGFRLPLAVRRSGDEVELWGLVRPTGGRASAEIYVADGGRMSKLRDVETRMDGTFEITSGYRDGRLWQLRWTDGDGEDLQGALVRSYAYALPETSEPAG